MEFPLGTSLSYEDDGAINVTIQQPAPHLEAQLIRGQGKIPNEAEFARLSEPIAMRSYAMELADRAFKQMHKMPARAVIVTHTKPNCSIKLEQIDILSDHGRDGTGYQFTCSGMRGEDAAYHLQQELRKRKFPLGFSLSYERDGSVSVRMEKPADWMKDRLVKALGTELDQAEFDRLSRGETMRHLALDLAETTMHAMQKELVQKRPPKDECKEILSVHNEVLGIEAYLIPVTYANQKKGKTCSVEFSGRFADEASEKLVNELKVRKYPAGTSRSTPTADGPKIYKVDFPQLQDWMLPDLRRTNPDLKLKPFNKYSKEEGFTDLVKEALAATYSDYVPISEDFVVAPRTDSKPGRAGSKTVTKGSRA